MAVAFVAVSAGATIAPLNPAYRDSEFDFYLTDLRAQAVMVQAGVDSPARAVAQARGIPVVELFPLLEAEAGLFTLSGPQGLRAARSGFAQPGDVALVLHTSGTTSGPKLVPLTQANICTSAQNIQAALGLVETDRCLNIMPLFHIHGLVGATLSSLAAGASVVCTPGFYAPQFFEWTEEYHPTWYTAVPTMHQAILVRAESNSEVIARCPLRLIRSSSSALPPQVMAQLEEVFGVPVIESYGMTEASHQMASNPLPPRQRKPGSVGVAAGPEVTVMGEAGRLLPPGQVGEVVVRGGNVTLGYENNPEAKRSAFSGGWFRTGDQGYLDGEGYLFLTGRLKEIINRGGEKISPREVDEALQGHPAVAQAVAFAVPDPRLGEQVAAAVVLREHAAATEREIREFAAGRLADFKVPRRVLVVEELPKGPTGKVQRLGLAEKLGLTAFDEAGPEAQAAFVAARTPVEERLVDIWGEVLGLGQVGVHDNFFQLGGDSILATQVISRVRAALKVELSLLRFFEAPTLADLARSIESPDRSAQEFETPTYQAISRVRELPLSFAQQRLWFLDQLEPDSSAYNRPVFIRLIGSLDLPALEQSLNRIVDRHEALRTTFPAVDGQPVQVISGSLTLTLAVEDLSDRPEGERQAEAARLAVEAAQGRFDLAQGPLVRVALLRLRQEEHVLLLTLHHIVFDGWSKDVLLRELLALYQALSAGKPSPLPPLPIQYADYSVRQRQETQGEGMERQLAYWKRQLAGSPGLLELPTDRPRALAQTSRGARGSLFLPAPLSAALRALSQREGATLFMTLLAAFQALLFRYTGQEDIAVGTPMAGRNRVEVEGLIGLFVNTLVLRTDLSGDPSFRELLGRVREVALGAYGHQDVPFERLVEELQPERSLSHTPFFQAMFVLQNTPGKVSGLPGLKVEDFEFESGTAKFDLTLEMVERAEGLTCSLEYRNDLFEGVTISRMLGHFRRLLEGIVADPNGQLSKLPLLTDYERQQLLVDWNETGTDYPREQSIPQLFEARAERTPNAVAVVFEGEQLTYRQLNSRANQLAHFLRKRGVGPEVLVGLCVERSPEMIVGLLGILKAGGAYVPLDPTYPKGRLAYMLKDAQVPVLLTQHRLVKRFPEHRTKLVCLDADWEVIVRESEGNPVSEVTAENLAYVTFTSGSTGTPKGVEVPHRGILRLLLGVDYAHLDATETFLQLAPLSFDASTFEVWGALLHGARLVLSPEKIPEPKELGHVIQRQGVTTLWLTTSLFNVVIDEAPEALSGIRQLLIGGEALSVPHVHRALERLSCTQMINGYGPTESTTFTCCYCIPNQLDRSVSSIPIGVPIGNTEVYLLDCSLNPVPIGVPGELHIGGAGLGRGYLNYPDLTAEKFIPNPFGQELGGRLYKTGDLARYLPDGNIEFLGRADDQVKIRGFRIEPGEVEAVLGRHPAVHQSVVLAREDRPGDKRLVAYLVPGQQQAPTSSELRSFLKEKLPDYMLPSAFVFLGALPRTPSGKVNRRALPAPEGLRPELEAAYVAPRTEVERIIATVWREVLRMEKVGLYDNFFDLGGHSLLLVQVYSKLQEVFGKDISMIDMFKYPTINALTTYLSQKKSEQSSSRQSDDSSEKLTAGKNRLQQLYQRSQRMGKRDRGLDE
jgi:amino acid adenylation domain-containing protein